MTVRAALVPGALTLLPAYAGQADPVADLRASCRAAVAALVAGGPSRVLLVSTPPRAEDSLRGVTTPAGVRVGRHLLDGAGHGGEVVEVHGDRVVAPGADDAVLAVANGSACRSEKAPGHLDERSFDFDAALERAVREGTAPPDDDAVAAQLWCHDLPVFRRLHQLVEGAAEVGYADDPHGVAYWVATWSRLRGGEQR